MLRFVSSSVTLLKVEPKMKSVVQLKSFVWIFFVETESSKPWLFIEATLPQRVPPMV